MNAEVFKFPTKSVTSEELEEFRSWFSAKPLTREQIASGPIDDIAQPGPWISPPDSKLSDDLLRVRAIVAALLGPGRVLLPDGIDVAIEVLQEIRKGVPR